MAQKNHGKYRWFLSKSNEKENTMDKNTLLSSFGRWVEPINFETLEKQVSHLKQDYYTKKLTTKSLLLLLLMLNSMKRRVCEPSQTASLKMSYKRLLNSNRSALHRFPAKSRKSIHPYTRISSLNWFRRFRAASKSESRYASENHRLEYNPAESYTFQMGNVPEN